MDFLFGRKKAVAQNPFGHIELDEVRIVFLCGAKREELRWDDLIEVGIVTTDEGPIQEDVYFMLLGPSKDQGLAIPQGADGNEVLLQKLQTLPGFDHAAVIKAMGCTSNKRFTCWKKGNA